MILNNHAWDGLSLKIAPEVRHAPGTIFDPTLPLLPSETVTMFIRLLRELPCTPWLDPLALSAGICVVRGFRVLDVITAVRSVDKGFRASIRREVDADQWDAIDAIAAYLDNSGFGDTWRCRAQFLGNYRQLAHELCRWYQSLPSDQQRSYQFLSSFTPLYFSEG